MGQALSKKADTHAVCISRERGVGGVQMGQALSKRAETHAVCMSRERGGEGRQLVWHW